MLSLGKRFSSRRRLTLFFLALATDSLGHLGAELLSALVEDVGVVGGDVCKGRALCVLVVLVERDDG